MKDQDRYFQKILGAYTVAPADETDIQKTVLAGKRLLMKNPVQELRWYRRIVNQFKYISPLLWFSQLLAIGLCMLLISQIGSDTDLTAILSAISFIVALLGVVGFPEVCKSFSYQMWELEQSCKYNLRQIVAIKLSIIGTIDLIIKTFYHWDDRFDYHFGNYSIHKPTNGIAYVGNGLVFICTL